MLKGFKNLVIFLLTAISSFEAGLLIFICFMAYAWTETHEKAKKKKCSGHHDRNEETGE